MPNRPINSPTLPQSHKMGNVIVLCFVALVLGLVIRSQVTEDSRFGWGMFGQNCQYLVYYDWVYPDGSFVPYRPGSHRELSHRGGSNKIRNHKQNHSRNTRYGMGTLRRWIGGYQSYLYDNHKPTDAVAIRASLIYAINYVPKHDGQASQNKWTTHQVHNQKRHYPSDISYWQQEQIIYPPARASEPGASESASESGGSS